MTSSFTSYCDRLLKSKLLRFLYFEFLREKKFFEVQYFAECGCQGRKSETIKQAYVFFNFNYTPHKSVKHLKIPQFF